MGIRSRRQRCSRPAVRHSLALNSPDASVPPPFPLPPTLAMRIPHSLRATGCQSGQATPAARRAHWVGAFTAAIITGRSRRAFAQPAREHYPFNASVLHHIGSQFVDSRLTSLIETCYVTSVRNGRVLAGRWLPGTVRSRTPLAGRAVHVSLSSSPLVSRLLIPAPRRRCPRRCA